MQNNQSLKHHYLPTFLPSSCYSLSCCTVNLMSFLLSSMTSIYIVNFFFNHCQNFMPCFSDILMILIKTKVSHVKMPCPPPKLFQNFSPPSPHKMTGSHTFSSEITTLLPSYLPLSVVYLVGKWLWLLLKLYYYIFLIYFFFLPVLQVCVASSALTFFDTGLYQNASFSSAEWNCQKAK